jgi:uncharacterized protein YdeI (YjbR/CyaY-like superfamily)
VSPTFFASAVQFRAWLEDNHRTATELMRPAGITAYEARNRKKTGVYSFEQDRPIVLAPSEVQDCKKNKLAWKFLETVAPSYKKAITHWVISTKQASTRARRLSQLIEACAEGRRLLMHRKSARHSQA